MTYEIISMHNNIYIILYFVTKIKRNIVFTEGKYKTKKIIIIIFKIPYTIITSMFYRVSNRYFMHII